MLYNIGYTNTVLIYCHSTVITKVMLLYNTEWYNDHGIAVNYHGKKFYNIGSRWELGQNLEMFWSEWNSNFGFRVYFSPSRYEVFVSTEDAASGTFLPDMQKGLERERGIKDFSQTFEN